MSLQLVPTQTVLGDSNNATTSDAALAVITAYVNRMYGSLPSVRFYLNPSRSWETATLSFYEADRNCWPVRQSERCVSVTALGLVASKQAGGNCYLETVREAIQFDWLHDWSDYAGCGVQTVG